MTTTGSQRISCAGIALIEVIPGEALMLPSVRQTGRAANRLTAPGGVFRVWPEVVREFEAELEAPAEHPELRLRVPERKICDFHEWFLSRERRELTPERELGEELVDEFKLLEQLDFAGLECEHLTTACIRRNSSRAGVSGEPTIYYFEVFRAHLSPRDRVALESALESGDEVGQSVSVHELLVGVTSTGRECAFSASLFLPYMSRAPALAPKRPFAEKG